MDLGLSLVVILGTVTRHSAAIVHYPTAAVPGPQSHLCLPRTHRYHRHRCRHHSIYLQRQLDTVNPSALKRRIRRTRFGALSFPG